MPKKISQKDIEYFRKKLETEKNILETELKSLGHKDQKKGGGWETSPSKMDVDNADENELADKLENFEENTAILEQLETQLTKVNAALDRIKNDTYGVCETSGDAIERERLEANPSATTCIRHMTDRTK